jgi:hypothetical protein
MTTNDFFAFLCTLHLCRYYELTDTHIEIVISVKNELTYGAIAQNLGYGADKKKVYNQMKALKKKLDAKTALDPKPVHDITGVYRKLGMFNW